MHLKFVGKNNKKKKKKQKKKKKRRTGCTVFYGRERRATNRNRRSNTGRFVRSYEFVFQFCWSSQTLSKTAAGTFQDFSGRPSLRASLERKALSVHQ